MKLRTETSVSDEWLLNQAIRDARVTSCIRELMKNGVDEHGRFAQSIEAPMIVQFSPGNKNPRRAKLESFNLLAPSTDSKELVEAITSKIGNSEISRRGYTEKGNPTGGVGWGARATLWATFDETHCFIYNNGEMIELHLVGAQRGGGLGGWKQTNRTTMGPEKAWDFADVNAIRPIKNSFDGCHLLRSFTDSFILFRARGISNQAHWETIRTPTRIQNALEKDIKKNRSWKNAFERHDGPMYFSCKGKTVSLQPPSVEKDSRFLPNPIIRPLASNKAGKKSSVKLTIVKNPIPLDQSGVEVRFNNKIVGIIGYHNIIDHPRAASRIQAEAVVTRKDVDEAKDVHWHKLSKEHDCVKEICEALREPIEEIIEEVHRVTYKEDLAKGAKSFADYLDKQFQRMSEKSSLLQGGVAPGSGLKGKREKTKSTPSRSRPTSKDNSKQRKKGKDQKPRGAGKRIKYLGQNHDVDGEIKQPIPGDSTLLSIDEREPGVLWVNPVAEVLEGLNILAELNCSKKRLTPKTQNVFETITRHAIEYFVFEQELLDWDLLQRSLRIIDSVARENIENTLKTNR